MFNFVRHHSQSAALAISYITAGALAMIWSSVWYMYLNGTEAGPHNWRYYVCLGLFLSGLAVFLIGLLIGRIGREAKAADTNTAGAVAPSVVAPAAMPAAPFAPAAAPGAPGVAPAGYVPQAGVPPLVAGPTNGGVVAGIGPNATGRSI